MNYDHLNEVYDDYLEHYGILGMKWGIRRYQNADGTLTTAGKKRYKNDTSEQIERSERRKAKVVKAAKTVAKVGAAGATAGFAVHALLSGRPAGAVSIGGKALGQLISSGILDSKTAASLTASHLAQNGTRSLAMSLWDNPSNPYYKPGPSKQYQEMMKDVLEYYLENK